ncbi:Uncharacterized protein C11orf74, partial [Nestor notabilis]
LLAEEERKTIHGSKADSLRKIFYTSELPNRNKQDGSPGRSKKIGVSLPPQLPNENETVMSKNWRAGGRDENDLRLSERVKISGGVTVPGSVHKLWSLLLPGEVEQTVTYCTPFFDKPIQMKSRTLSVPQLLDSKTQELLGDDVHPFSVDEEFDYDCAALTPKFSEAELKAIIDLSEEKKTG